MKRKVWRVCVAVILVMIVGFFSVRSLVGWKPFKDVEQGDLRYFWMQGTYVGENARWWNVNYVYSNAVLEVLKDTKVVPYFGRYDPGDESMMYFIYSDREDKLTFNRIGVTLDPKPILTIGAKAYRIDQEKAERLKSIWEMSRNK